MNSMLGPQTPNSIVCSLVAWPIMLLCFSKGLSNLHFAVATSSFPSSKLTSLTSPHHSSALDLLGGTLVRTE